MYNTIEGDNDYVESEDLETEDNPKSPFEELLEDDENNQDEDYDTDVEYSDEESDDYDENDVDD